MSYLLSKSEEIHFHMVCSIILHFMFLHRINHFQYCCGEAVTVIRDIFGLMFEILALKDMEKIFTSRKVWLSVVVVGSV